MNDIHILVTMPQHAVFRTFFDADAMAALEHIGTVHWNTLGRQYTQDELGAAVRGMDICVTGWGTPVFDEAVLAQADRLRLIAHTGGSVKPYVTDAVYGRGIRVVSGNEVFAESVAESVVAYALASLRQIPYHSVNLAGGIWPESFANRGLLDRSVGIVGYGMIARYVVGMLAPFHCPIKVFSRHIGQDELDRCHMEKAELEELFATCDIISIHSGMTPENHHLVTRELLQSMKPGALLVNTARGAVIDEPALCEVLAARPDLSAALDVYETEPLPAGHPLEKLPNVLLMPHMGPPPGRHPQRDAGYPALSGRAAHELRDQPQLCGENVGVLKRAARERRAAVRARSKGGTGNETETEAGAGGRGRARPILLCALRKNARLRN